MTARPLPGVRRSERRRNAIVVGGGPAGLATAVALARSGLEVLVLERERPPIDKACGEGLMPAGVAALRELGVELDSREVSRFRGIRYLSDEAEVRADFPGEHGMAVRRPVLHRALLERAEEAGVHFAWETPVRGLIERGVLTDRGSLEARWVIGADGLHSNVRAWGGFGRPSSRRKRFGIRRHYRVAPWSDDIEVHWGDHAEAYVWGLPGDEIGVAILWSGGATTFDRLLHRFPGLEARLAGAEVTSRDRGSGPFDQRVREVSRGHLALVGDAAGYRDAITGEGLALAFEQALALAACLADGSLRRYPRAVRRLTRRPYAFIALLLHAEARPAMRRRLLIALEEEPWIFERLVAIHNRAASPTSLGVTGAWTLVRRMILDAGS